ncbi:MAG: serine/threonine protein kinase, partial [Myxococcales bacterium]|nr:serine/threonine protein kinase [Myxococcales bacterium]
METTATAKAELLAPGARVGRYHLLRRLAIGGMAELHLACAEGVAGFQKVVVLKRVLPHLAADADFVQLFLNEARLAANLDHPNLVQVMDIGEAEGEYFYVMEYVHGRNARELLAEAANRGGLPLPVALTVVVAAASGLHHAHERCDLDGRPLGLVHRDVSPSNVLVSYDGAVKVTDFGIAKASARTAETIGGAMKGKIGYMSPEQCRGEAVDRRSDVFALGILLYELTTTERLFFGESDFAVLNRVVQGRFDPPSSRVPGYPPALERIVLRALAGDPAQRTPTAEALLRELEAFAHDARLRCSAAVVADWMGEAFGRPPFPRVEQRPTATDDPLDAIPTLVLVGGAGLAHPEARTRAEPTASVTAVTMPSPTPGKAIEPTSRRGRWGIAGGVLAGLGATALGLRLWGGSGESPARDSLPPAAATTEAPAEAPAEATAPDPAAATRSATEPAQADASGSTTDAPDSGPATAATDTTGS